MARGPIVPSGYYYTPALGGMQGSGFFEGVLGGIEAAKAADIQRERLRAAREARQWDNAMKAAALAGGFAGEDPLAQVLGQQPGQQGPPARRGAPRQGRQPAGRQAGVAPPSDPFAAGEMAADQQQMWELEKTLNEYNAAMGEFEARGGYQRSGVRTEESETGQTEDQLNRALEEQARKHAENQALTARLAAEAEQPFALPEMGRPSGNAFRAWVNENYPESAAEFSLDPEGRPGNRNMRRAWARHGEEYSQMLEQRGREEESERARGMTDEEWDRWYQQSPGWTDAIRAHNLRRGKEDELSKVFPGFGERREERREERATTPEGWTQEGDPLAATAKALRDEELVEATRLRPHVPSGGRGRRQQKKNRKRAKQLLDSVRNLEEQERVRDEAMRAGDAEGVSRADKQMEDLRTMIGPGFESKRRLAGFGLGDVARPVAGEGISEARRTASEERERYGFENPATRLGLDPTTMLDPGTLAALNELAGQGDNRARRFLKGQGIDADLAIREFGKGLPGDVAEHRRRIAELLHQDVQGAVDVLEEAGASTEELQKALEYRLERQFTKDWGGRKNKKAREAEAWRLAQLSPKERRMELRIMTDGYTSRYPGTKTSRAGRYTSKRDLDYADVKSRRIEISKLDDKIADLVSDKKDAPADVAAGIDDELAGLRASRTQRKGALRRAEEKLGMDPGDPIPSDVGGGGEVTGGPGPGAERLPAAAEEGVDRRATAPKRWMERYLASLDIGEPATPNGVRDAIGQAYDHAPSAFFGTKGDAQDAAEAAFLEANPDWERHVSGGGTYTEDPIPAADYLVESMSDSLAELNLTNVSGEVIGSKAKARRKLEKAIDRFFSEDKEWRRGAGRSGRRHRRSGGRGEVYSKDRLSLQEKWDWYVQAARDLEENFGWAPQTNLQRLEDSLERGVVF
jgi:hypothetical protein